MTETPTFGIAGWKNSGKTTLLASLVKAFADRGMRVSTVKHAHHAFELDNEGTDSFRHKQAGAVEVALVSKGRWAIQHELKGRPEPTLADMLARLSPCDLVLVEGYKKADIPKLEMIGEENPARPLWQDDPNVVAIATDSEVQACPLPRFRREQVADIADFITRHCGLV